MSTRVGGGSHRVTCLLPLGVLSTVVGKLRVRQSALQWLLLVIGVVFRLL